MRVLGIDFGERRIGLALSDPTGTLASPLPTLKRRAGKRPPLAAIEGIIAEHGVEAIVLGLPVTLSGEESDWTRLVRSVGESLAKRTGLQVHYIDERFTSVMAEKAVRGVGLPKKKREEKGRVDAAAAVLILQAWLDRRPAADDPSGPGPTVASSRDHESHRTGNTC
jgi:putative Holliday junction resolvase